MSDPVKCPLCGKYNWDKLKKCQCGFDFTYYVPEDPLWFYITAKGKQGPITQGKLKHLISSGELNQNTLVWSESLTDWTESSKIETFKIKTYDGIKESTVLPPNLNPPPVPDGYEIPVKGITSKQIRPWVRFWARMIDYAVFSILLVIIILIIAPSILSINVFFVFTIITFLWIFLESYLLSTWGMTLGKSILKVLIVNPDGSKINFNSALNRSFKVWGYGMAFGIPIASFITQIISYYNLEDKKMTTWDRQGGFKIIHENIGGLRVAIAIIILVGPFLFSGLIR